MSSAKMWPETAAALKHFDAVLGSLLDESEKVSLQNDARLQAAGSSSFFKSALSNTKQSSSTNSYVPSVRRPPVFRQTSDDGTNSEKSSTVFNDVRGRELASQWTITDKPHNANYARQSVSSSSVLSCSISSSHTVVIPGNVHVKSMRETNGVDVKLTMRDRNGKPFEVRARCPKHGTATAWVNRYKSHGH